MLCPFGYIAIGALSGFDPAFALTALPPLLAASAYLLTRYLSAPREAPTARRSLPVAAIAGWLAEAASWLVILGFLTVISGFTLLTRFERLGLSSTFFLAATLLCLPVALLRRTALEQRLSRLPDGAARLAPLAILLGAAALAISYLVRDPRFI